MKRKRADELLLEQGHFATIEEARKAILAGLVRAGADHLVHKANETFAKDVQLTAEEPFPYVSKGALKLLPALDRHLADLSGMTALDLGASTGGFTDLMLQRGAQRVYAVDVGTGQLHLKLRQDPRVISMEQTHARDLTPELIPEPIDVLTADVSFIGLRQVLPPAAPFLTAAAWAFVLVKPQFEALRHEVQRGGVVHDPEVHQRVIDEVCRHAADNLGWTKRDVLPTTPRGTNANREFIVVFHN